MAKHVYIEGERECRAAMAQRLTQLRTVFKATQAAVAQLVGVKQPAWNRYEKGTRDIDLVVLIRFCEIFRVSADWVLLGDLDSLSEEVIAELVHEYPQVLAETSARRIAPAVSALA